MTLTDVVERYFKGERVINFHPSDRQGDCHLRYHFDNGAELWMGTEDGEILVMFTKDAEKLEKTIQLLIY
jgi:hypothetical protein